MSAFQSDDYYNVIAEHVLETLQADSKLADAGALDVKTWEQELREDAGDFNSNELPAVSVTCDLSSVEETVKSFAARVERSMNQQEAETKQLSDVTADLLESISGSVQVTPVGTVIGGGPVEGNNLRGVAVLSFAVAVDFTVVID